MVFKRGAALVPPIRRLQASRDVLLAERDMVSAELTTVQGEVARLGREMGEAAEAARRALLAARSPFYHYHAGFDAEGLIRRHAVAGLQPRAGFITNFLGVLVDPRYFPGLLDERAGTVEEIPIPCNWHADIAEWAAALRAVELAAERGRFTVLELGCGWGCWMNNSGVAARRRGLEVRLIGVEGDEGHIGFAREACAVNGFAAEQVTLHHGIAAARAGTALFPRQDVAGQTWGLQPLFGADEATAREAVASGRYDALRMFTLAELTEGHERVDLLHVDIQGGEAELVAGSLEVLAEKVGYLLIGTHSRQIEGALFETLLAAGWRLDIERPAVMVLTDEGPVVTTDGVQGWRR